MDAAAIDAQVDVWDSEAQANPEPVATEQLIGEEVEVPVVSEELVAVAAEARVVMPKSSGAGSWLRWPNSSADRPDSSR